MVYGKTGSRAVNLHSRAHAGFVCIPHKIDRSLRRRSPHIAKKMRIDIWRDAPVALRRPRLKQSVLEWDFNSFACGNYHGGRRAEHGASASASNDHLIVCASDIRINNMVSGAA